MDNARSHRAIVSALNPCRFSPDRRHRYTLLHTWDAPLSQGRIAMWIGLNPSTADEHDLDPTLRRIRSFTAREGFNGFVMTNLFAYRATDPRAMKAAVDPVGNENDRWLVRSARGAALIVAAWGTHGGFRGRDREVLTLLRESGRPVWCLGLTRAGFPRHPLYVGGDAPLVALP
jgi:hypothetical protein